LYCSSEVDPLAMAVTSSRCAGVTHVGDIRRLGEEAVGVMRPDLVVGGSPCQDLSRLRGEL
jgi:site-specific DNA-cytosine methylase